LTPALFEGEETRISGNERESHEKKSLTNVNSQKDMENTCISPMDSVKKDHFRYLFLFILKELHDNSEGKCLLTPE
jgi:hypothetical protein